MNDAERVADFLETSTSRDWALGKVVATERAALGSVEVKFVDRVVLPGWEMGFRAAANKNPEDYFHIIEACAWAIPFTGGFVDYLYETAGA